MQELPMAANRDGGDSVPPGRGAVGGVVFGHLPRGGGTMDGPGANSAPKSTVIAEIGNVLGASCAIDGSWPVGALHPIPTHGSGQRPASLARDGSPAGNYRYNNRRLPGKTYSEGMKTQKTDTNSLRCRRR